MAARIQEEFGITADLIGGSGGIYELTVDGTVVFSHRGARNLIPAEEKLLEKIRKQLDQL